MYYDEKKCSLCNEIKTLDEFYRDNASSTGVSSRCILCSRDTSAKFSKTKKGVIYSSYYGQTQNSKKRNHTTQNYSKTELYDWVTVKNNILFQKLYDDWVKSGYVSDLRPSIDRLDSNKPYTLNNIQIITWKENYMKEIDNQKTEVAQIKDGVIVAVYESIHEASRQLGKSRGFSSISGCCNGLNKTAYGYTWEKTTNISTERLKQWELTAEKECLHIKPIKQDTRILQIYKGVYLNIYDTMRQAATEIGRSDVSDIAKCCSGKRKTAYGFSWIKATKVNKDKLDKWLKTYSKSDITQILLDIKIDKDLRVFQFDKNMNYITTYNNGTIAGEKTEISKTGINKCIRDKTHICKGYYWFRLKNLTVDQKIISGVGDV